MMITVAICTWNRQELLDRTLLSLLGLELPDRLDWELLVVNNNCTDGTDAVIARYAERLPLRRVFVATPGLSNARNAALAEAAGDYLVWTDDDVQVEPGWLAAYARAFQRWPEAAVFGGPITPWFEGSPPAWLVAVWPRVANAYATRDLGPVEIPLDAQHLPFGANYAVRLPDHRRYLYDPELGRKGKQMVGGEETTLILAMLAAGSQGRWVPAARVRHFIPRARQNREYLRRYFYGQGICHAQANPAAGPALLFGIPRWLIRAALQAELGYRARLWAGSPANWIEHLTRASMYWGMLAETVRRQRCRRTLAGTVRAQVADHDDFRPGERQVRVSKR